jgi:uncharacterized protein (UPF0333 family)
MVANRGQASAELLFAIAIMLLMVMPVLFNAYFNIGQQEEKLSLSVASASAARIANLADSVGYLGGNASIIAEIDVPRGTEEVKTQNNEIVFKMQTSSGPVDIVRASRFRIIQTTLVEKNDAKGIYRIEIAASQGASGQEIRMQKV